MTPKKNRDTESSTGESDKKIQNTWEYRSGKLVLRIVCTLFFLSYLSATGPASWTWAHAAFYKNQPASQIDRLIEAHISSPDQSKILAWVQMRAPEERLSIEEKIVRHSATANSFLFLLFSDWALERKDYEQAVFWNFYARYRLRYDALRCGAPNSVTNMKGIVSIMSEEAIDKIISVKPKLVPDTISKVLDYDANHPAENDPSGICEFIYRLEKGKFSPVQRENWPALRHTLRAITEHSLKQMKAGAAAPKPTYPDINALPNGTDKESE